MALADQRLKLKKVEQEDCKLLWHWANDPVVRAASFLSEPISLEDHLRWFNNKMNLSGYYHFIAYNTQDEPIGQVRFDIDEQLQSIVSISLASNQRHQGYGKLVLKMAIEELSKYILVSSIQAFIKVDNLASIKLFESVGFKNVGLNLISPEVLAVKYIFEFLEYYK